MINDFEIEVDMDKFLEKIVNDTVQNLQRSSPKRGENKYAKGWTKEKINGVYIVYNENQPKLTHLLENGHLSRNASWVKARPHIAEVEKKLDKEIKANAHLIKLELK